MGKLMIHDTLDYMQKTYGNRLRWVREPEACTGIRIVTETQLFSTPPEIETYVSHGKTKN
jgi:hypothetical protein